MPDVINNHRLIIAMSFNANASMDMLLIFSRSVSIITT